MGTQYGHVKQDLHHFDWTAQRQQTIKLPISIFNAYDELIMNKHVLFILNNLKLIFL